MTWIRMLGGLFVAASVFGGMTYLVSEYFGAEAAFFVGLFFAGLIVFGVGASMTEDPPGADDLDD